MNWKDLFEQKILNRGYRYFHDKAVERISISENTIIATVNGSELYEVKIGLKNDEIVEMHCSCPYAEGGKNCKHMAAVLYKWEFIKENSKKDDTVQKNEIHKKKEQKSVDYYSKFYPHKVIAIKELRLDTGMGLAEAKNVIEELFSKIDAENEKQAENTHAVRNEHITRKKSKVKKKRDFDAAFRLFNLKFWMVMAGFVAFIAVTGIIHPEINTDESVNMLLISSLFFVVMIIRHKHLKRYFDSEEYKLKLEEKKRIKEEKRREKEKKNQEKQRYKTVHLDKRLAEPVAKSQNDGPGCCLVSLVLMIFYLPLKIIINLTKKYY